MVDRCFQVTLMFLSLDFKRKFIIKMNSHNYHKNAQTIYLLV